MDYVTTPKAIATFESRGLNGQEKQVEGIKDLAARLFTAIDDIPVPPGNNEAGRLVAKAKTDLETSVMFAVKALSRNH